MKVDMSLLKQKVTEYNQVLENTRSFRKQWNDGTKQLIIDTLRDIPGVLQDPLAEVLLDAIGAYTLNLHVLYWTAAPTRLGEQAIRSEVTDRLNTALTAAGIGFPVPTYAMQVGAQQASGEETRPDRVPPFGAPG